MTAQTADGTARRTRVRWLIILVLFVITTINYADRATFSIAGQSASRSWAWIPWPWATSCRPSPGPMCWARSRAARCWTGSAPRRCYTAALLLWSGFTLLQGFAGIFSGLAAAVALFAMRFMVGLAESPSFPANARIVAAWFPGPERGTASAIFNSAQYFSLVAFAPLMGWLAHSFGWRSVFIVMGAIGIVAAFFFVRLIHSPVDHPKINKAEFDYIEAGGGLVRMEDKNTANGAAFTWANVRQVLTNRMLLGVYLGQYCINVLTYFFVTWFPIYLVKERGLSIMQAGFTAALPALCGFAGGILGGMISDGLLKKTGNLDIARKTPLLLGMVLATSIILCNFVEQEWLVIVIMAGAFFGKGVASLGWAVVADTSPKEMAGVTGGIFNTFGNVAGIVTPIVIGYIVKGTGSFDGALIFVGAHCVICIAAYFLIVGKIQRLVLKPAA